MNFEQAAKTRKQTGMAAEFCISEDNKKWWLPIVVIVRPSASVLLSGTAAAPFIYTLF